MKTMIQFWAMSDLRVRFLATKEDKRSGVYLFNFFAEEAKRDFLE